jgi:hypothetical protein
LGKGRKSKLETGKSKLDNRNRKIETGSSKIENNFVVGGNMGGAPSSIPSRRFMKDFTDLEVWQAARETQHQIYSVARTLPDSEKFGMAAQLRRAAVSVTANLAEGYGRFGYQENAQFCRQARGSVY